MSSIPTGSVVDLELCQADGSYNDQILGFYQNTTYKTVLNLKNIGFASSVIGEWHKFRIDLRTEGYVTITDLEDPTKTFTNSNAFTGTVNRVLLLTSEGTTEIRLRNVKVYPI